MRVANKDLKIRTRDFGLRVIRLVDALPRRKSTTVIGNQLLRSATSVGANYRSACRGRSRAEFISKLNIALEEADESLYWLELLTEAKLLPATHLLGLIDEANQLVAILTTSTKTARQNNVKAVAK
ncbi:MAG TPA: four helix bundle protein [Anaerolineales bacterium]|nr:four helix bundle protein [Anaerolineales bacterium]HRQ91862.1 four helix bundle protein [Anaerolineales bacterium]